MSRLLSHKLFFNAVAIANIYAVGYVWLVGSADLLREGGAGVLIAFGRLAGLLLAFAILVELVLVSRFPPIERVYGFDRQNMLHRWLGYGIVGTLLAHPALLSLGYGMQMGRSAWEQFLSFVTDWHAVFAATVATVLILIVGVLSVPVIRRLFKYEIWYVLHLPLYFAVALAFNHQTASGDVAYGGALYYWLTLNIVVFGMVLLYRFLAPIYLNAKHRFRVARIVRESPDVVSVYLTGRRMEDFRFEAGQWARVFFLQRTMWYGHPFSFSAPYDGKEVRFSIKALGDWTGRAGELTPGTRVWVEGPLGALTLSHARTSSSLAASVSLRSSRCSARSYGALTRYSSTPHAPAPTSSSSGRSRQPVYAVGVSSPQRCVMGMR